MREIGGTAVIIRALIEMGAIDGACLAAAGETLAQTRTGLWGVRPALITTETARGGSDFWPLSIEA